jgi:hypothetical protein
MNPHRQYVSAQQHLDELRRDAERVGLRRQLCRPQRHAGAKSFATWIGALTGHPDAARRSGATPEVIGPGALRSRPASSECGQC